MNSLYNKIIKDIAKYVKHAINEVDYSNIDHSYVAKQKERRIKDYYLSQGYKVTFFNAKNRDAINSATDIVVRGNLPSSYTETPAFIKVQKRSKNEENNHGFRVELLDDLTDITNNNNPKYDVNYIAFLVENPAAEGEYHIYVHSKQNILETAQQLADSKQKRDEYGNQFKRYLKHQGIFLTNKYIKDKNLYVDKFKLEQPLKYRIL